MPQLPHQLCALDRTDRLPVVQPLDHALRMPRGARRRIVRLTQLLLDEEVAVPPR